MTSDTVFQKKVRLTPLLAVSGNSRYNNDSIGSSERIRTSMRCANVVPHLVKRGAPTKQTSYLAMTIAISR